MSDERWSEVPRISYAQTYEDVRLWKALGGLEDCIWVDIGAAHPVVSSVTQLFSLRGWHGINVEPGPTFDALCEQRSRDVNLGAVVTDHEGEIEFHVAWPHSDISSIDLHNLEADADNVESWEVVRRPATTLARVLDEHAGDLGLAFLKVDVEGAEREVLAGNDWDRFRPLVVVVEAIEPGTHRPSFAGWEPILLDAGYEFAFDDGVNRFYARADRPELRDRLAEPVSVLDGFVQNLSLPPEFQLGDPGLVAQIADRDRTIAETEAILARVRGHEAELVLAVDHLTVRAAELEAELVRLRAGWELRVGRVAGRVVRPLLPILRPIGDAVLGILRWWRGRR